MDSSARVYTSYDVKDPPAHPGPGWTRFVCISDTHSRTPDMPHGDVLLHAGDLSSWGYVPQLEVTVKWLESLPHPVKIITAGNHDLCLDEEWINSGSIYTKMSGEELGGDLTMKDFRRAHALLRSASAQAANIHYLQYESHRFTTQNGRTWEVYGSPAAPRHALGSFQYETGFNGGEGKELYKSIPPSTEILLTHTPPHGVCDVTRRGKLAGCTALAARMQSADLSRCRLHVFGHIHEAHGFFLDAERDRVSVNAAMHHGSQAIIVDLRN